MFNLLACPTTRSHLRKSQRRHTIASRHCASTDRVIHEIVDTWFSVGCWKPAPFLAFGMLGDEMPEVLRLALLAFPAGLIGFIAAPCCSLLVPVYLPYALATPPPSVPTAPSRQLVLLNQPGGSTAAAEPASDADGTVSPAEMAPTRA